jgi:hypothetical protein
MKMTNIWKFFDEKKENDKEMKMICKHYINDNLCWKYGINGFIIKLAMLIFEEFLFTHGSGPCEPKVIWEFCDLREICDLREKFEKLLKNTLFQN